MKKTMTTVDLRRNRNLLAFFYLSYVVMFLIYQNAILDLSGTDGFVKSAVATLLTSPISVLILSFSWRGSGLIGFLLYHSISALVILLCINVSFAAGILSLRRILEITVRDFSYYFFSSVLLLVVLGLPIRKYLK